jgi:hypothetical protein
MEDKVLIAVGTVAVVAVLSKLKSVVTKPKLNPPPGPWTLPLIGSIHHIVSNPLPYRAMRELAHKHGPLMMLWLGEVPTLVVSSPEAAQAITKTHTVTSTAPSTYSPSTAWTWFSGPTASSGGSSASSACWSC